MPGLLQAYGLMGWRVGYVAYWDPDGSDVTGIGGGLLKCQDTVSHTTHGMCPCTHARMHMPQRACKVACTCRPLLRCTPCAVPPAYRGSSHPWAAPVRWLAKQNFVTHQCPCCAEVQACLGCDTFSGTVPPSSLSLASSCTGNTHMHISLYTQTQARVSSYITNHAQNTRTSDCS